MIQEITEVRSLDQSGLEIYRTLRRNDEHNRQGVFVAEGNKVVVRLFASACEIVSVLITESWLDRCKNDLEKRPEKIVVYVGSTELMKKIVGFNYHQGIIAVAKIPGSGDLDEVVGRIGENPLIVAFDDLASAENVGVIVRNCAACGVDALISSRTSSDPYLRRSVRNSMGAIFMMPLVYTENLVDTLRQLTVRYGFTTIAADLGKESVSLHQVDFRKSCCVVMGNEHHGVSCGVLAQCSVKMVIPMQRRATIDSFNVGCANAIILHEAFHQRNEE